MMDNFFKEQELLASPIRSLQYMLRRLSKRYPYLTNVVDSGVFDDQTLESVMRFQKERYPPVTGVVDLGTWSAIRDEWLQFESQTGLPNAVRVFPEDGRGIEPGTYDFNLLIPQAIFQVLAERIEGIQIATPNGIHDDASVANTRWLQEKAGLPVTGIFDRQTWEQVRQLYEVMITNTHPGAGHTFG